MARRCGYMFWLLSYGLIGLSIAQENKGSVYLKLHRSSKLFNVLYVFPYLDKKAKRFGSFNMIMSAKNRIIEEYPEMSSSKIVEGKLKKMAKCP